MTYLPLHKRIWILQNKFQFGVYRDLVNIMNGLKDLTIILENKEEHKPIENNPTIM